MISIETTSQKIRRTIDLLSACERRLIKIAPPPMRFFLGTHQVHWLRDERFVDIPLFISRRRLAEYRSLPRSVTDFALDSGGFTELQMYGKWQSSPDEYADEVRRYIGFYGRKLLWVAPQDWMCEPIVLSGGMARRSICFAGTGLSVEEHQIRTVRNFIELRARLGSKVIPVLQGWKLTDYWRCCDMYKSHGVKLEDEPTVGVGTVCRRQSTNAATQIMQTLAVDGLRLHGFGFKKGGIKNCLSFLASADSTAWSDTARQNPILLLGHDRPGDGRPRGHKNCANCAEWALMWRKQLLTEVRDAA